jgi:dTDP-D-glucose 4,6-dehydratase
VDRSIEGPGAFIDSNFTGALNLLQAVRAHWVQLPSDRQEQSKKQVVEAICALMDQWRPQGAPHARLIACVSDRPGPDRRYAIDASKITVA